MNKLANYN